MSLQSIQLRKLLKLGFASPSLRTSDLRDDIRAELRKIAGVKEDGNDFYLSFWADAKGHVYGSHDLHTATEGRIADNWRRKNLYPRLRDGFLLWWNERRRWTNAPFEPGPSLRGSYEIPELCALIKIDNIMSVRDGLGVDRFVYPYFAPEPEMTDDAARLALWMLGRALPDVPHHEIRILDVIRGRTFSIDRIPLLGDEEVRLRQMYETLVRERETLRKGYD